MILKSLIYNYTFLLLLLITVICSTLIYKNWQSKTLKGSLNVIQGDGIDYYSYLPSIFIDKDIAHLNSKNPFVVETPTGNINMHPIGVAVMQLPFFAVAYVYTVFLHKKIIAYSHPFQKAINFGALFYLLLGVYFLNKLLINSGFKNTISAITCMCLVFGTTLLNYCIYEPVMSHIYSFALIAAFAFFNQKLAARFFNHTIYILALIFGLIILVRPIDCLVLLLIPVFYNSMDEFIKRVKDLFKNKITLLVAGLIIFSIYFIQMFVWYKQTGHFIQNSYKDNGFYFLNPHIFEMLFGFNSGVIPYTPLFILVGISVCLLFFKNKFKAMITGIFLLLSLYLYSSYWGWTYFDGIGTRVFVDYYVFAGLALCYLFNQLYMAPTTILVGVITILCMMFNLIICYQYKEGIIQGCGMNFEKYKYVFLKTRPFYRKSLGGSYDLQPYSKIAKKQRVVLDSKFIKILKYAVKTKSNDFYNYVKNEYGVSYECSNLKLNSKKMHFKIRLDKLEYSKNYSNNALIAISHSDSVGNNKSFNAFKLNEIPQTNHLAQWKQFNYSYTMNSNFIKKDKIAVFIWNRNKEQFAIDNFSVKVYDYGRTN